MNTRRIIRASERIMTLAKRAIVSDDQDTRRDQILSCFCNLASDLDKMVDVAGRPNWGGVVMASYDLHTAACNAEERRSGTFAHAGSEMALVGSLHAFAAVLGFTLSDAGTAPTDTEDEAAQMAVEQRMAAE
jgi:hypothetical protein